MQFDAGPDNPEFVTGEAHRSCRQRLQEIGLGRELCGVKHNSQSPEFTSTYQRGQ